MYKIYNAFICGKEFCYSKRPLLIMKLTMVLLTVAFLQASAKSSVGIVKTTEVAKTVTGKVIDENGQPLPGVTVKVKGGTTSAQTDAQGSYRINLSDDNATLVFTFVGYKDQEVSARGKTVVLVTMEPANTGLDEVVVVAYGTQKRTSVTGAVSTINPAEIKRNSVTDITNAITGRTPGVRVTQTTSLPGRFESSIDIRGFTGANGVGAPLFVIDGIPRDKAAFDHMDANEIESFSVLKDATAAIYGVQAANGVILITTKKGEVGKVQFNYTGDYGVQFITKYPRLTDSYQEASLYDEMQFNGQVSGRGDPITPKWSYAQIQDFYNGKTTSVDWISTIMGNRANQAHHNMTISGGSEAVKFFTSGGYMEEGGLLKSHIEKSHKYNARQSVTATLAKGLDLITNVDFVNEIWSAQNATTARAYDLARNTWGLTPQDEIFLFGNPKYYRQFDSQGTHNPAALIQRDVAGYQDEDQKQFHTVTTLRWSVPYLKGLQAQVVVGFDANNTLNKNFVKNFKQWDYDYVNSKLRSYDHPGQSTLSDAFSENIRNSIQGQLTYTKHIGKSNFTVLGAYDQFFFGTDNINAGTTFAVDVLDLLGAGISSLATVGGTRSSNSNRSFIGRVNYDFSGRYLVEAGGRYEGSSYFPSNSRWGFFPYISGGWRISEESFIKNNFKFVDNIKFRGSYGKIGDDAGAGGGNFPQFTVGLVYPRVNSFSVPINGSRDRGMQSGTIFGTTLVKGYEPKYVANPDITWYSSTTTDLAIELSLWKGKFTFEGDIYRRDRDGLLAAKIVAIPGNFGANLPQTNLNSDRTHGFELTFGTHQQVGEVTYNISANYSYTRSLYRHYEEAARTNPYDEWTNIRSNRYTDFIRGPEALNGSAGQFQSYEEIYAYPSNIDGSSNRSILPGDIKFIDSNGNGVKDGGDSIILGIGGSKPRSYFGVTIDVQWRGFDITMLLQGATAYKLNYSDSLSKPFVRDPQSPINSFIDRWHRLDLFDQSSPWVSGKWPSTGSRQNALDGASGYTVFDGTYARIKQFQIGYSFPKKLLSKVNINRLRIFAGAYNLYTWHGKGLDFVDPEFTSSNTFSSSSDFNPPMTMNVTLGAQLTF